MENEPRGKNPYVFPVLLVFVLWAIKWFEVQNDVDFSDYGVYPRKLEGLLGVFLTPLIHGDFKHLTNNSVPLIVLGTGVFYFYRDVAFKIHIWIWVLSGLWIWLAARPAHHIGASGLVYGLASFIFFSGIFRRYYKMLALSLLVVFLYGSMVWGIFPIKVGVSWEGHLYGSIAGLILAYHYRNIGPQRKVYEWENEDEEEDDDGQDDIHHDSKPNQNPITINYIYREDDKN